tara:strand:+ start:17513 stop:19042 length:1530 start_codon:yes stop_codon:yes gene_type:complete
MTRLISRNSVRITTTIGCLACFLTVVPLMAQDTGQIEASGTPSMQPMPTTNLDFVRQRIRSLESDAIESVTPLPEGESKDLDAVVMYTHGRVQWRSGSDASWKDAAVDDRMNAGAMIRTGLKSAMTVRVGLNATILIDSNSRVTIPNLLHNGDTLETAVKVSRGQADIKVNRVGLTNDFSVVTPTGALAVKGTGFGVRSDAYGTSIIASRDNMMNAIEVHYYASKLAYYLSGGAISSTDQSNPAIAALLETAPPPSTNKAEEQDAADSDTPEGEAISTTNPINQTIRIDLSIQQQDRNQEVTTYIEEQFLEDLMELAEDLDNGASEEIIEEIIEQIEEDIEEEVEESETDPVEVWELPGFGFFDEIPDEFKGVVAAGIYFDLVTDTGTIEFPGQSIVPGLFEARLFEQLQYSDSTGVNAAMNLILDYGASRDQGSDEPNINDMRVILNIIDTFCRSTFAGDAVKIQICRECYSGAVQEAFFQSDQEPNAYFQGLMENLELGGVVEPPNP